MSAFPARPGRALGGLVVVLTSAARLPVAAALLATCLPLIAAARELRATSLPGVPGRSPHSAAQPMRSSRS
jgi:hypothetical protein